jgi:hypothetical protein
MAKARRTLAVTLCGCLRKMCLSTSCIYTISLNYVFRYLDFLRFGLPQINPPGSRED